MSNMEGTSFYCRFFCGLMLLIFSVFVCLFFVFCFVFCFCCCFAICPRSVALVSNVAGVSGLSILDCLFSFVKSNSHKSVLLDKVEVRIWCVERTCELN